jgi:MFS family permease
MFLYAMAKSFWGFALSECMAAIGSTFASGAFQAWFVDRVRHQGYDGPLGKIFSREQQIKSGMGIVAAILGAFAAEKNSSMPWFLSGYIFAILAIISSLGIKEEEFTRKKFSFGEGMRAMREIVKTSTHYTMTNSAVRFIVIMGVAQFFAVQAPNMQWQPFFMEFLKHKSSLGFIFSGISIAMMVGAMLAPRLLRKIGSERAALSAVQTAIGTGICLTIFCRSFFPAVSVFMIHEIFRGMFVPLKDAYLNDNIPSGKRATLISFESISHHLGGMIGLLVSGAIAQYTSMQSAWMLSGVVLIASTLTLLKNGRR